MIWMPAGSGARSPDGIPLHPLSLTRLGLDESWGFNLELNQLFYDVLVLYIGPSVKIDKMNPKWKSTFPFSFSKHLFTNSTSNIQVGPSSIPALINWIILKLDNPCWMGPTFNLCPLSLKLSTFLIPYRIQLVPFSLFLSELKILHFTFTFPFHLLLLKRQPVVWWVGNLGFAS